MTLEERVSRLEGINEQILERLNSLEASTNARFNSLEARFNSLEASVNARLNTQMTITVGMWITTMAVALSTLVTVLLRT